MTAPVLLTDRLRLDGHRVDDLDALAAMWAEPAVHAFIGDGLPRSREEIWMRLVRSVGQWVVFGYGQWMVRDRASGAVRGEIGLIEARRAMQPPLDAPEMGWLIAAEAQGRGLAGEALAAILAWADAHGLARTRCIVDPANAASIRLAGRVGYVPAGTAIYRDRPIHVFERAPASGGAPAA